ncbi:MAG: restriction endonuclease subunit S, partial [Treponema sp.]|nr:restriction endonuclease subunit S [Treponema sp.]
PTLEEQQRIVNRIETLFAKLDQAKEKAQNVVDSFETRKASILHKAFNNQLKIGNGELKDEDWVETTIGECGNWYGGGTPNTAVEEYWKDGTVLWITSKDMKSDYIEDTQLHVTQTGIDNSSAKLIKEPAVLFVMRSGILRRTFPVCMVEKEFTVNQDLKALVPFANVNLKFLFYYCKAEEKKILNECMKSGTTVESINAQSLMNLKIKLPPINYQLSIVNFLDVILEKETKAKESAEVVLEQIDLLKKSILARAFRGEL